MGTLAQNREMQKIRPETFFVIHASETVLVDDELQLTFVRHSHKDVTEQMGASPLLVSIAYKNISTNDEASKTYLWESKPPFVWRWKAYLFVVTKYDYNAMMEMKVFRDSEAQ